MLFKYLDYRHWIKAWIILSKTTDNPYNFQKVASYLQIQKSYFSRVMNSGACLSQDQGYLLARLTELSHKEERFLRILIEYDRCGIDDRKQSLLTEIKNMQNAEVKSEKFLKKELSNDTIFSYHARPDLQIVHIAILTGDGTFEALNQSRDQLGITTEKLISIIKELIDLNIIELNGNRYINRAKDMHISSEHPLTQINQVLLRSRSIAKLMSQTAKENYLFSATFSAEEDTFFEIKSEYMLFLKKIENSVKQASSTNTYQINFDLFPWVKND